MTACRTSRKGLSSPQEPRKRWEAILDRLPEDTPLLGAEIGVWHGVCSRALLTARPLLTLFLVDDYGVRPDPADRNTCSTNACIGRSHEQMRQALATARRATHFARTRRVFLTMDFEEAALTVNQGCLDFAFLDADHTAEGTWRAIKTYWPKVKDGGLLCGHDYGHPCETWGVKEAVGHFADLHGLEVETGPDYTWFIDKPITPARQRGNVAYMRAT